MTLSHVNDVKHYRDRATEMRVLAAMMEGPDTRGIMIRLAEDYDKLAEHAAQRSNGEVPPSAWSPRPRPAPSTRLGGQ